MAPPVPSTRALRALRAQLGFVESYTCASCLHLTPRSFGGLRSRRFSARVLGRSSAKSACTTFTVASQLQLVQRRNVTYVAPVTSVNAARSVPERNRELHAALSTLESQAAEYVNLSMLALALRGLESKDPITRIAGKMIGRQLFYRICRADRLLVQSNATRADARRLVRILLVDPKSAEEEWERALITEDSDQRALLIRYGVNFDIDNTNPLVRVLSVPAAALNTHKLEVLLVQRDESNSFTDRNRQKEEDTLVQTIETPISTTGRHSQVTYPVHKAILYGKGIRGLLNAEYDEIDFEDPWSSSRRAAVNFSQNAPEQAPSSLGLSLISVEQAERALSYARQSSGSTQAFETDWQESHVGDLSQFIYTGILPSTTLKPLHRRYIQDILLSASARLAQEQTALELMRPDSAEITASLVPIRDSIRVWSESAHNELRTELANAFAGRSWRKLAWWKLPFRVDDVGMIGSDILSRFYLADAERGSIWVAGRMEQAGLTNALSELMADQTEQKEILRKVERGELIPVKNSKSREDPETYFHATEPWPQHIAESRHRLLTRTLPALQARSQALLLEALSGTSISTAVGALAYVMVSSTGLYEAGAVVAFGTVVCLSRLQRLWDKAKDIFIQDVENEGRIALEKIERECKDIVKQGEVQESALADQEIRDGARAAIEKAMQALQRLK